MGVKMDIGIFHPVSMEQRVERTCSLTAYFDAEIWEKNFRALWVPPQGGLTPGWRALKGETSDTSKMLCYTFYSEWEAELLPGQDCWSPTVSVVLFRQGMSSVFLRQLQRHMGRLKRLIPPVKEEVHKFRLPWAEGHVGKPPIKCRVSNRPINLLNKYRLCTY